MNNTNETLVAMREALESCLDFIMRLDRAFNPFMQNLLENAIAKAKAALAAPLRNCDVFKSEDEAKSAFLAYYNEAYDLKGTKDEVDYCDLKHDVDGILHDYIEWLFAPVKGVPNHADERKRCP